MERERRDRADSVSGFDNSLTVQSRIQPAMRKNKGVALWAQNCITPGVTGVTLTTGNVGSLEGLLAGNTLSAKTTASLPTAVNTSGPALPDGFTALLALLGVTPTPPDQSEAKGTEEPSPAGASADPNAILPLVTAAPEQIASAVIRAMLQGGSLRTDVQSVSAPAAEPEREKPEVTVPPAVGLPAVDLSSVMLPTSLGTGAVIRESNEEKGKNDAAEHTPSCEVATSLSSEPVTPMPEFFVPATVPSEALSQAPAATPALQMVTSGVPAFTTPSVGTPAIDHRFLGLPTESRDTGSPELLHSSEVIPAGKRTENTPVAFALRLTAADSPTNQPAAEVRALELAPVKAAGQTVSSAATKSTSASSVADAVQPVADLQANPGGTEHREQNSEERPRVSKDAQATTRESAPVIPEPQTVAPVTPAPQRETQSVEPLVSTEPVARSAAVPPAMQLEEIPKPAASAHEIAVRVSSPNESPVDVHIAQRGNEVRVAVRTADEQMQSSLRQDLGKLVDRLEQTGFRAEAMPVRENAVRWERINTPTVETAPVLAIHRSGDVSSDVRGDSSSHSDGRDRDGDPNQAGARQQQQQRRQQRQPKDFWEDFA